MTATYYEIAIAELGAALKEKAELENKLAAEMAHNIALQCQVKNLRREIDRVYKAALDATLVCGWK